jgi:glycosyltransferase EpsD
MEAMATGLPLVVTDCRGNRDLVQNGENGFVVGIDDAEGMAERIEYIYKNKKIREKAREYNLENIKNYSLDVVRIKMSEIYKEMLKN